MDQLTLGLSVPAPPSSATSLLWIDAGAPPPSKPLHPCGGHCYVCGGTIATGVRVADACGPTYNDHDLAACPTSTHVCEACAWCLQGKPPDTLRTWSIVYRTDQPPPPSNPKAFREFATAWQGSVKADPAPVLDVLLDPPRSSWLCAVAVSGQLHVVPFSQVNAGAGPWTVRVDRDSVVATPAVFGHVLHHACALRAAGFVRDDIVTGEPHPSKLVKYGIDTWRRHDAVLRTYRGSPLMALVILFVRKETAHDLSTRTQRYAADRPRGPVGPRRDALRIDG